MSRINSIPAIWISLLVRKPRVNARANTAHPDTPGIPASIRGSLENELESYVTSSLIKKMLDDWELRSTHVKEQVSTKIVLNKQDLIKVEALAEAYKLPASDLLANLINTTLQEIEEQMPYVAGDKVIRIEEGDPIYEDVGRTPEYQAAKDRLQRK